MKKWILLGLAAFLAVGLLLIRFGPRPPAPNTITDPPIESPTVTAETEELPQTDDPRTETINALLQTMTLEEKVGQVFFARCPTGSEIDTIADYHPAGFVLFARDFEARTPDSLREVLAACQTASKIPMLLGVDEEGGSVVRASRFSVFRDKPFASPQTLYAAGGMDAIVADAAEKARFLHDLGLNVNLAPVCDVTTQSDGFMYSRSFGQDAQATAAYVSAVVKASQENGIACVLKHFPGYGNNADTHTDVVTDTRPLEEFLEHDFLPFSSGINAGAGCILFSHTIMDCVDSTRPASLSAAAHELLWNSLNYRGVCLTDDLAMAGVSTSSTEESIAVTALKNGNDLLLSSDLASQYTEVLQAVQSGALSTDVLDIAVQNVLGWKYDSGLL